jgi:23S rRNA pseudouridine1911/1915/1917 synthase
VQLADQLKTPIRGDIKYGSSQRNDDTNINLHARSLEFLHPVKKEQVKITAQVPREDQIWGLFHEMEEW